MESEERKRNVKKEAEKKWVLEQIEANKQKKIDKKFEDEKFKFEANELQKQNAMKEITKEQNYKNVLKITCFNLKFYLKSFINCVQIIKWHLWRCIEAKWLTQGSKNKGILMR